MIELPTHTCKYCEHTWVPRIPTRPQRCPGCKRLYWDREPLTEDQQQFVDEVVQEITEL